MQNNILTMEHTLLLDHTAYRTKPDNKNIGAISNRIINRSTTVSTQELANTCINGQTFTPAYLKGSRDTKGWVGQSILGLDFDNKDSKTGLKVANPISFNQIKERLNEYGFDCTFAYTTFSHTEEWHKFRVILQLNLCICDRQLLNEVMEALFILFPEADPATKNPATILFGGKELIYSNYDYFFDLDLLFETAEFYAVRNSSSKNIKRDINRVRKKLGNSEIRSKNHTPYNIYIGNVENASSYRTEEKEIQILRGVDFSRLRKEVKVLDDLMNPNKKLLHPILLGLATNLRYIEGGQKLYEKCIKANPDYAQEEKLKIMAYCKIKNYLPKPLRVFSSYKEDLAFSNLLIAAKKKEIIRVKQYSTRTIEEIRSELTSTIEEISKSTDKSVHVVKAPPGSGKTENYSEQDDVVIAVPYHSLKNEIVEKKRIKVPYSITPSMDGLPYEVRDTLEYYYSIGAIDRANQYLADMAEKNKSVKEYLNACLNCYASTNTVLTTHQKGLFISWQHETIIFDEDILNILLPIGQVTMNDLLRLEKSIDNSNDKRTISSLIDDIRQGRVNSPRKMDLGIFEKYSAVEDAVLTSSVKYESNILHFFDSCYYVVDARDPSKIHYIRKYELPKDKKIIILSATANEKLYRYLLGDRLTFYDLSDIEMAGLIEQDTKHSTSRSSLPKRVQDIAAKVGNLPTITFKQNKEAFQNPVEEMHFGHCSGSNAYEGEDIAVVGTPHVSPVVIALYAVALELPIKTSDLSRVRQQMVQHNGFRFWFNTYDNEHLRCLQFYFIESELRQAVGRARPYTKPSKVVLSSNYPLPEACINQQEVELGKQRLEKNRQNYLEKRFSTDSPSVCTSHTV